MAERARAANGATRKPAATPQTADEHHWTDLGNARRLIERHGSDLRFVHPWRTWLVWDGRRWTEDATGEVTRRVKETVDALFDWAVNRLRKLRDMGNDDTTATERNHLEKLRQHAIK